MTYPWKALFLLLIVLSACSEVENQNDTGVIISTDRLRAEMEDPSLVLFHVGTREVYDSIHIPGSLFLDPYKFTVSSEGLRNQLPGLDSIFALLGTLGADKNSKIVLYYESERMITRASRVFLTLDYAGLGDRCQVLNGGLDGWLERSQDSVTSQVTEKVTGDKELRSVTGDKEVIILADELNHHRWDPEYVIVDVRSAEEYYGEIDSTGRLGTRGHIEGAYFMDYHLLLSESNPQVIKDNEELLKEFKKAGMDREKTAVFYCGSGIRASLSYLAAKHLGFPALMYDGSIQEWEQLGMPQTSPAIRSTQTK
ncbi:MAG: rhodanese-like domain-containing protein [Bacteroidota bacterium]